MKNDEIKKLRKLSRVELIDIIYELQLNEIELKNIIQDLETRLEDRTILIDKAGSIAQASLQLNDVFINAQKAADQYVEEVKKLVERKINNEE